MADPRHRIVHVALDEKGVVRRSPEVEHERAVAIYDLVEENRFVPAECPDKGPFRLHLRIEDGTRLILDIRDEADTPLTEVTVPLQPFRGIVRDYFMVCESYYNAIKHASLAQIEALDMGRRGLHNEGSELLRERMADKVEVDFDTARRLFTLICVLHLRG
ncbi:MAG TPA: UPF0262 family protein [Azospirillaceae bacterium]|nr:UPF0262 family protein [Azospirillaceae bacterium]